MADETQTADAVQTGGADAVKALFGDAGAETKADQTETKAADQTETQQDPPEQYEKGKIPKQFHRGEGQDPDYDGLVKSWYDTRKNHDTVVAENKELKRAASASVPEKYEDYRSRIDWDRIKEVAPNAYMADDQGANAAADKLARRLHEQQVPEAKANRVMEDFWTDLESMVPENKSEDQLRKEAIAYLGANGQTMMHELGEFMATAAERQKFSEAEMEMIPVIQTNGPLANIVWRAFRLNGSTAPPSTNGRVDTGKNIDPDQERREARAALGVPEEEWRKNKTAILARYRRAFPENFERA